MIHKNKAPLLQQQRGDIQAVIASGFGWLPSSCFRLLTIDDVGPARQWLAAMLDAKLVRSIEDVGVLKAASAAGPDHLAALAFSHGGLQRLGLTDTADFPFPTAFRSGMGSPLRQDLLREGPRCWQWGDQPAEGEEPQRQVVHILFAHWWNGPVECPFPPLPPGAFTVREVNGDPNYFRGPDLYEPFGFRDGISQPTIYGLKQDTEEKPKTVFAQDHLVAPGEFILGYRNEYDELSYCPHMKRVAQSLQGTAWIDNFAFNGSYLAVREIDQDIAALRALDDVVMPPSSFPPGVCPAEKMMGRHRDGRPLGRAAGPRLDDDEANAFRYRVEDEDGFVTPRGSHIRRANPRDMLGHDVESGVMSSKLHRLMRRGRPYTSGERVGVFFFACNTDLERQFEFIHQRWMRNPRFAELEDEDDPMLGAAGAARRFSMPGPPSGRCLSFQSMTTTVGGGYFFLPGLNALRALV